jgi:hypothetical protein
MKTALIIGVLAIGLGLMAWWGWRRLLRRETERLLNFREALASPEIIDEIMAIGDADRAAAIERGERADEAELKRLAEEFLGHDGDRAYLAARSLEAAEERALPALRAILDDPRLARAYAEDGLYPVGSIPADDMVELLLPHLDDETVAALFAALGSQEGKARDFLLVLLAHSGRESTAPLLREALERPSEEFELRFLLCNALSDVPDPGPALRALAPLLATQDADSDALAAALNLDAEEAIATRDTSLPLSLDDELIVAAAQAKTALPRPMLTAALADIDAYLTGGKDDYETSASVLILDGLNPDATTMPRLNAALGAPCSVLVYCARTTLLFTKELASLWQIVEPHSDEEAPLQLLAVRAARWLAFEVDQGGFAPYILHSEAAEIERALAGLELIGADRRLEIAREALSDLPREPDTGLVDLAEVGRNEARFTPLDQAWHTLEAEDVDHLAFVYVRSLS